MEKSIFEYIKERVKDSVLPVDFHLGTEFAETDKVDIGNSVHNVNQVNTSDSDQGEKPDYLTEDEIRSDLNQAEPSDSEIIFADGAMDGICTYHMGCGKITNQDMKRIADAVKAASDGNIEQARILIKEIGKVNRAINVIDEFEGYIFQNQENLDIDNIFMFAIDTMVQSTDVESIKFALMITELVSRPNEHLKKSIRMLGLSDEYTIFVVFNMLTWDNANQEIFDLVKKVNGWGKIHAIERLEPTTQEIKDWLFYEGIENAIMPEYSALTCWQKSGVSERLKTKLSNKDFIAIRQLIHFLINEGPVTGISGIENKIEILTDFANQAKNQKLTSEDLKTIVLVKDYLKEFSLSPELVKAYEELLEE